MVHFQPLVCEGLDTFKLRLSQTPPPLHLTQVNLNTSPGLVQLLATAASSSDLRITPPISVLQQQLAAVGGGSEGWGGVGPEGLGLPDADSILAAAMGEGVNLALYYIISRF